MEVIAAFVGGGIVGFVVGALVYRNNAKAANKTIADLQATVSDLRGKRFRG